MFDFLSLKKTLADVGDQARKQRQQIETLRRQREDIVTAPCAKEDIKLAVETWVAQKSADYANRLAFKLQQVITHPEVLARDGFAAHQTSLHGTTGPSAGDLAMYFGPAIADSALCAFFGQGLITSLHGIIDGMEWPAGALPMRGREKKISDIDVQLEKLIRQEEALVREAQEAGIQIS